jgi:hypothetical protein
MESVTLVVNECISSMVVVVEVVTGGGGSDVIVDVSEITLVSDTVINDVGVSFSVIVDMSVK